MVAGEYSIREIVGTEPMEYVRRGGLGMSGPAGHLRYLVRDMTRDTSGINPKPTIRD